MPSLEEGVYLIACLLTSCEGYVKEREPEERESLPLHHRPQQDFEEEER